MSSGLVPVTTRIAAIPEFVDEEVAILSEPEDIESIVAGINWLIDRPDDFLVMSASASKRIKQLRCKEKIIDLEINCMRLL
jgi:glycosyltransferase involved in cell wall biosynthesis